jgi:hypothetical protein
MGCPKLCFTKDPDGFSSDISVDTDPIMVGQETNITVCLHNGGDFAGDASVAIYWAPVNNDLTLGTSTLISFYGNLNLIPSETVPTGGDGAFFSFAWTPPAGLESSLSDPTQLAIFVQAIAVPVAGPDGCPGRWNQDDFDRSHRHNAAQVFDFLAD